MTKSFPPEACRILIAGNPATVKKRYEICENELAVQAPETPGAPREMGEGP